MKCTREFLISHLCRDIGLTERDARGAIRVILEAITEKLEHGAEIHLDGFGQFTLQVWKARSRPTQILKHPNGDRLIPGQSRQTIRVKFKPSKNLKHRVKAGYYDRDPKINPPKLPSNVQGTTKPRTSSKEAIQRAANPQGSEATVVERQVSTPARVQPPV